MSANVLVVAEVSDGKARKSSLSAIGFAKQVCAETSAAFDVLVPGEGTAAAAAELTGFGARKVIRAEIAGGPIAERFAATIANATSEGSYGIVVSPASALGKDLMPRVAAKLKTGLASDVVGVEVDGSNVRYRRSLFTGNVLSTTALRGSTHVVTVRLSEFEAPAVSGGESPVEEAKVVADPTSDRIEFLGLDVVKSERPELTEADVVVSGGRGLKSEDNFKTVLEPLVDALGAAMGASRAACDAGYVPGDLQVGQTGKVVAPKLYIAVGISGAIQHLAGMKGSKTIVAINKDKEAPIGEVADYFLVADLFEAVPQLTEAVQKVRAGR